MVNLSTADRQQLITLLQGLPVLSTARERRLLLDLAGLKQLIPLMDISGSPFIAVSEITSFLSDYGRLKGDYEALGVFLNLIKQYMGEEPRAFLDSLLLKYNMMTPIATSPVALSWRGTETNEEVLEKIIGENTLRPIAFLAQGLQVARSVAYTSINTGIERWSGTGFLIAPDLFLTNHHVIPEAEMLPRAIFRFNYEDNFRGEAQKPDEYYAKNGGIYHNNETLDYALIQLERRAGDNWGWLPLWVKPVNVGERVNIIQHPAGQSKRISLQNNFVEYVNDSVVQYITSTLPGSSGAPVFNDGWEVVALHHAGGNIREPKTQRGYFRNEGILISSVIADLPREIRQLLESETGLQH